MLWKTYRNWMLTYNGTCKNPKRLNSGLFSQPRVQRERETHVIVQTAPSCLNIPSITPSTCSDRPHPRPQLIRVVLSSLTEAGTKQHLLNQWHSFCCSWLIKCDWPAREFRLVCGQRGCLFRWFFFCQLKSALQYFFHTAAHEPACIFIFGD